MLSLDDVRRYMDLAEAIASESHDPNTKVGCAIVGLPGNLVFRCNAFPAKVLETEARWARPAKYKWVVHAEIRALVALGRGARGASVISTQIPCSTCMGVLIEAGIAEVYCPPPNTLDEKWKEDATISVLMAEEAAVALFFYKGDKLER